MRKAVTISMSEDMHRYITEHRRHVTVSEYIRSLVLQEQRRREEFLAKPLPPLRRANDVMALGEALEQLEKLKAILQGNRREGDRTLNKIDL